MASWGRSRGPHVEGRGPLGHAAPLDEVQQAAHRVHPAPALGGSAVSTAPTGSAPPARLFWPSTENSAARGSSPGRCLGASADRNSPTGSGRASAGSCHAAMPHE